MSIVALRTFCSASGKGGTGRASASTRAGASSPPAWRSFLDDVAGRNDSLARDAKALRRPDDTVDETGTGGGAGESVVRRAPVGKSGRDGLPRYACLDGRGCSNSSLECDASAKSSALRVRGCGCCCGWAECGRGGGGLGERENRDAIGRSALDGLLVGGLDGYGESVRAEDGRGDMDEDDSWGLDER